MYKVKIRNSFYHVLLYYYFKQAYYVYCGSIGSEYGKAGHYDLVEQKHIYEKILSKIKGVRYSEPSFLNEIPILLNIKYGYPIEFELVHTEKFWFEYIINMDYKKAYECMDVHRRNDKIVRLHKGSTLYSEPMTSNGLKELLAIFNTIEAIEYVRNKFIRDEKIENIPGNQGWGIFGDTGNAYRLK